MNSPVGSHSPPLSAEDGKARNRLRFWQRPQFRLAGLFFFPAGIWLISAPLVTAVENSISLFLLRRVVSVVFAVFDALGYPMIQEGNVLVLPRGRVGVVEACSGIRSLMGCLFAGTFLAAAYLDKLWKKMILVGLAVVLAFAANLLRSLFLTGWAYAYGVEAIEGEIHDWTGFAVLGVTVVGLFSLLPFFQGRLWCRIGDWIVGREPTRNTPLPPGESSVIGGVTGTDKTATFSVRTRTARDSAGRE